MSKLDEINAARSKLGLPAASPTSGETPPADVPKEGEGLWRKLARLGEGSSVSAGMRGALNTLSFGGLDELNSKLYSMIGMGDYDSNLKQERDMQSKLATDHPVANLAGEVAGAVLPSMVTGGAAGGATTLLGAAARGAGTAAVQSGAQSFGEGEGGTANRLRDALNGFLIGGTLGGVLGGVTNKAGKVFKGAARLSDQKSIADLTRARDAAYDAVAQSGDVIDGAMLSQNMNQVAQDIRTSFFYDPTSGVDQGIERILNKIDNRLHPQTTAGAPKAVDMTIGELDRMQRDAWKVYNRTDDPRVLDVINGINRTMDAAAANGSDLLKQAREAARVVSNTKLFDKEFKRAGNSVAKGTGDPTTKFRDVAGRLLDNEKKAKFLNPDERMALQRVVDGTMPENLTRWLGKQAPNGRNFSSMLAAMSFYYNPVLGTAHLAGTHGAAKLGETSAKANLAAARGVISQSAAPAIATQSPSVGTAAIQTATPSMLDMVGMGGSGDVGNGTLMQINALRQAQQQGPQQ